MIAGANRPRGRQPATSTFPTSEAKPETGSPDMIDLGGKLVLVTGGSRGIGAATVRALCAAGAEMVLHYGRNGRQAEEIVEELGRERCLPLGADLSSPSAIPELWNEALAWKGRIDVLVNNAGIIPSASITDDRERWARAWERTLRVNLISVADLCREAILHFRERGGGDTIINIASRAAFRGDDPEFMHYAASKGGVIALTRSIARGFAAENILAFAVAPGFVETEMVADFIWERGKASLTQDNPMGEMAPPEDVANVVTFLAAGLAPHATGTTIDINGASYVR